MRFLVIVLGPFILAVAISMCLRTRPFLRATVSLCGAAWLSFWCFAIWTIRYKPAMAHMPGSPDPAVDDAFILGMRAMSDVLDDPFYVLFAAVVILAVASSLEGFLHCGRPTNSQ